MRLPFLQSVGEQRVVTDTFGGYNHNLRIQDNEFFETKNLTTEHFPMLASRKKRAVLDLTFSRLQGIICKEGLYWIDDGTLYANGDATGLTGLNDPAGQTQRERQMVSMGAYICIFPDKKYINSMDLSDYGDMGAVWSVSNATVNYRMCHQDGTLYENVTRSSEEPESPGANDVWIDNATGEAKVYSSYSESWTVLETVYTRIEFTTMGQLPLKFREYDGVQILGLYDDDLNGSKILYGIGGEAQNQKDYIVVIGIQEEAHTQQDANVSIRRVVPDLDFVCEAQNRLWGCRYGNDGTQNLNELYCCALGDFRNWEQYLGLATDSWRASRGSDGPFTGCVNYLGSPTFFKENVIHPVSVSSVGAHQVGDIPARGVQQGSHKSLAIVNETLYYKTRSGVVAWQGGMPQDVGAALGGESYYEAAAGVFGGRYYISMRDAAGDWQLFVYDVLRGLWMHEDGLHVEQFAAWGDELYASSENRILALNGVNGTAFSATPETSLSWTAESGIIAYSQGTMGAGTQPVRYVSRFSIRLKTEKGARIRLYIEYDSSGEWIFSGEVRVRDVNSFTLPVRPRRCDHLRIRLVGEGEARIFSIARVLERGSDVF